MKILLSAYACEPNVGSEPAVGWGWANILAQHGHDVWVITRENNKEVIEQYLLSNPIKNLNFIYYDIPKKFRFWKKGRTGIHLYYLLWQYFAYKKAKLWHKTVSFDLVHHVTFVTIRQPSFMGGLKIPFILGPLGGADRTPSHLLESYRFKDRLFDIIRNVVTKISQWDPLLHLSYASAKKIYVTSEETARLVPKRFRHKVVKQLAIAISPISNNEEKLVQNNATKVLFVGQLISLKGIVFAIKAMKLISNKHKNVTLTIVGTGANQKQLENLVISLRLQEVIKFAGWVPNNEMGSVYRAHDVFLFPSLRDSGGLVVLEAMSYGLPVICLDLGGPKEIVTSDSGVVVDSTGAPDKIVSDLANALSQFINDSNFLEKQSNGALSRVQKFTWNNLYETIYGDVVNDFEG